MGQQINYVWSDKENWEIKLQSFFSFPFPLLCKRPMFLNQVVTCWSPWAIYLPRKRGSPPWDLQQDRNTVDMSILFTVTSNFICVHQTWRAFCSEKTFFFTSYLTSLGIETFIFLNICLDFSFWTRFLHEPCFLAYIIIF